MDERKGEGCSNTGKTKKQKRSETAQIDTNNPRHTGRQQSRGLLWVQQLRNIVHDVKLRAGATGEIPWSSQATPTRKTQCRRAHTQTVQREKNAAHLRRHFVVALDFLLGIKVENKRPVVAWWAAESGQDAQVSK